ncbi:hypothetical protein LTR95_015453, partial [Oleoguttula sp. CCFEE 5521]
ARTTKQVANLGRIEIGRKPSTTLGLYATSAPSTGSHTASSSLRFSLCDGHYSALFDHSAPGLSSNALVCIRNVDLPRPSSCATRRDRDRGSILANSSTQHNSRYTDGPSQRPKFQFQRPSTALQSAPSNNLLAASELLLELPAFALSPVPSLSEFPRAASLANPAAIGEYDRSSELRETCGFDRNELVDELVE